MANFCQYCGKPLQDGESCSCPQAQAEAAQQEGYQQPPQPAAPNPVVLAFRKLLPYLKSYVKAPMSTAQDLMAQKDVTFAGVLLGVQADAAGLLLFGILQGLCNTINALSGLGKVTFGASIPMSLIFGILAGIAAMLAWMMLTVPVLQSLVSDPSKGRFWICVIVGVLASLLIGAWASFTLGGNAVGHMTVTGYGETHSFNEIGNSIGDLMEELLDELF